ncbi:DUF6165 family protein [Vulcanococcus limneticus]|uniref:DUF6165 family protein n=1 Tax=Vulcanococcus limneticus TaxID=2170428 RepID=UPI00398BEBF9
MGKPKRSSSGFSKAKPSEAPKQQVAKGAAGAGAKEQQAIALINQGKPEEAEAIYRELIEAGTRNHAVYGNLAAICESKGKIKAAIEYLQISVGLSQGNPEAHYRIGKLHKTAGNYSQAISSYQTALLSNKNDHRVLNSLGIALRLNGDPEQAALFIKQALAESPGRADYLNNLGNSLFDAKKIEDAIAAYRAAIHSNPGLAMAHSGLGNAYLSQGKTDKAVESYRKGLEIQPRFSACLNNLGLALHDLGETDQALDAYNKALELQPDYPEAIKNQAITLLIRGDYESGWKQYEKRLDCQDRKALNAKPGCSKWQGEEIAKDSKLLVVSEQGLGDTLQFMRYALALQDQGISISLCAPAKLHSLIQVSGFDQSLLTPKQANQVSKGNWIPLLSVPRHLDVSPENPIITEPYIRTTNELISKWQRILSAKQQPIIGINWQGNPDQETTNSIGRSLPLGTFAPIATQTNATLLSLQKGFGSEQLETCSFKDRFVSCQDQVNETWDFLETAAIIANCDLVITSDTSVAHLAGGMGKTTWLLLKRVPDWRWGLEGDTTFWYPSMRLFRQKERGNWDEVMKRVAEALQEHFGDSSAPPQPASAPQPAIKAEPIQDIQAPISLGELIDKITILQIKTKHLQGTALENAQKELDALETTLNNLQLSIDPTLIQRLKEVNQDLWQIEYDIRDQERQKSFDETFIRLARSVYQRNDQRAAIKKEINTTYGSAFVEEKSYQQY